MKKKYIATYIESPMYAIFFKEAWMYCFSRRHLIQYTPTFTCISNCYIVNGFPFPNDNIPKLRDDYRTKNFSNENVKKWFMIATKPSRMDQYTKQLLDAKYGCFEMKEINGTINDMLINIYNQRKKVEGQDKLNLSMVFEYLYTKVVAAFIGRIIFTDDHMSNVAYVNVTYYRHYRIKCKGFIYNFYMPPGKMIQFIDLERYVFNFGPYDVFSNVSLGHLTGEELNEATKKYHYNNQQLINFNRVIATYSTNVAIMDKGMLAFLDPKIIHPILFVNHEEYNIAKNIMSAPFVHDIKTFCQVMETNLLPKYLTAPPPNIETRVFNLDLDNDKLRVITQDTIYTQIT